MTQRLPQNKAKKQHWVPFSYLKYFSIPETRGNDNPEAWIFSKDDGDPRSVPLRSFARKKFLYSPRNNKGERSWETEDKLQKLESLMGHLWPSLVDGLVDFASEVLKKGLALYISTLYLRHPSNIKKTTETHRQFVEFYETLPKDTEGNPFIGEVVNKGTVYQFDNSNYEKYKLADKNELQQLFVDFIHSEAVRCAEILLEKRWSVLFSDKPLFITTDKPVVVVNRDRETFGLKTKGTMITFPISPTRILILDDLHNEPSGRYYPLSQEGPGPINLTLWRNAENFMVSPRHTDEVCVEMLAWADKFDKEQEGV